MMQELHILQTKVLRELSLHQTRRFSDMMSVTELTSDDFKFHLRKLVKLGLVLKNIDGVYELTARGKELANRFDYDDQAPIRQPKLTTVVFLKRHNPTTGEIEYLFQQRLRQPFFHYWGAIGEPIRWGEAFETAAARGPLEQTGLVSQLSFKGFYRQRDKLEGSQEILEDKLFVIFVANHSGDRLKDWPFASNQWADADWLKSQPQHFDSCSAMLTMLEDDLSFSEGITTYSTGIF